MDKKDIKRRLEAAEKQNLGLLDEIKNLKAKLAEMKDEPEIPDKPVFDANERYWRMYPTLKHIKSYVIPFDHDSYEFITCSYVSRFVDGGWINAHWKENDNE